MAKFELTARICQYLDPHLTFPLLEFLCDKQVRREWFRCAGEQHTHTHAPTRHNSMRAAFACVVAVEMPKTMGATVPGKFPANI